jgi:transmembrane sensor
MAGSTRTEREAAAWLARRDACGWSGRDQARLDAWLAEATAHRVAWVRLESAWRESGRLKALAAGLPAGTVPERLSRPAFPPPRAERAAPGPLNAAALVFAPRARPAKSRFPAATVAVVLAVGAALALGWRHYAPAVRPVAYGTPVGDIESLPLADGTQATLGSDSRIVVALSRRERHVDLQRGEAFFHAAKDPGRPFVVAAAGHRAVAVGTRFSVRRDVDGVRVVVTEGLVRLESDPGPDGRRQPTALLPAGSIALATARGVSVQAGTVAQAEQALSWREGFLAFHDTPLADAVAEFNRYSARRIVIADPSVAALRVGGNFRLSNAEAFVRLLEQGFPVRAERRGKEIVLHRQ